MLPFCTVTGISLPHTSVTCAGERVNAESPADWPEKTIVAKRPLPDAPDCEPKV